MPQTRKKPAAAEAIQDLTEKTVTATEAVETLKATNGAHEPEPKKPVGFVPRPRWVRATADWQEDRDDSEKLSAEINVAGLNIGNVSWIWGAEYTLSELWDFLATRVRNWNATAYDRESRTMKVAPGPDEIGWKAFSLLDTALFVDFTLLVAKALNGGDARASFLASSASPPATDDAKNSA